MKTVRVFITIAFLMIVSLGVKAQDKYEYAVVTYRPGIIYSKGSIVISKQGKYETSEFKLPEGSVFDNLTPVIEVVNKLSDEGWEVYNTTTSLGDGRTAFTYYYLRKKKN